MSKGQLKEIFFLSEKIGLPKKLKMRSALIFFFISQLKPNECTMKIFKEDFLKSTSIFSLPKKL